MSATAVLRHTRMPWLQQPPAVVPSRRRSTVMRRSVSGIPDASMAPYSHLSTPVYSLVTEDPDQPGSCTMNIVTYASPVALKPERYYAMGLYVGTVSHANMIKTRRGVLQILQEQHAPLLQLLGRTSGRQVDKLSQLREQGWSLVSWQGLPVLADALGVIELQIEGTPSDCGDHEVALCRVLQYETLQQPSPGPLNPLYTAYLKEQGLL